MADNITTMNTVWENASTDYQTRIPLATRDNMTAVGNAILNYTVAKNEFIDAIVNRISLVVVSSKMANNKLAMFKKGMLEYGADIEEIFTSMAQAQHFDVAVAETEVFKRVSPDVKAMFHRVNREDFYKVTIEEAQLKRAFLSSDGLGKLVASIVNSMYSADAHDEYVLMKELVAQYFSNVATGETSHKFIEVPKVVDQTTAQAFMRAVKQTSTDFTFMSPDFNPQGVMQKSEKSEQVLLIHKNVDTLISTDLLAWAFHGDNFDANIQKVVVDDFGSLANAQAALVDKNFFMVWDKLYETRQQYNGQGMYWQYWLHHHQLLSTSQFQNAVLFKIDDGIA
jgi:hypothetical protein